MDQRIQRTAQLGRSVDVTAPPTTTTIPSVRSEAVMSAGPPPPWVARRTECHCRRYRSRVATESEALPRVDLPDASPIAASGASLPARRVSSWPNGCTLSSAPRPRAGDPVTPAGGHGRGSRGQHVVLSPGRPRKSLGYLVPSTRPSRRTDARAVEEPPSLPSPPRHWRRTNAHDPGPCLGFDCHL
jgi:hypothetical protein